MAYCFYLRTLGEIKGVLFSVICKLFNEFLRLELKIDAGSSCFEVLLLPLRALFLSRVPLEVFSMCFSRMTFELARILPLDNISSVLLSSKTSLVELLKQLV